MKKSKQFTATALALSLCFVVTACSNKELGTVTTDNSLDVFIPSNSLIEGNTGHIDTKNLFPSKVEEDDYEITYEIYFSDLTLWTGNFFAMEESFAAVTSAFSEDYANPENVQNFTDGMKEMNLIFSRIDLVRPTSDMVELHQNLVDLTDALSGTIGKMIEVLEDDFINGGQESLDEYNLLFAMDYIQNYNDYATCLTAVQEELNAKLG